MDSIRDLVSGTIAGIGGVVVGQPLDVLRVRSQTTWAERNGSLLTNFGTMMRSEGLSALYKGVVPPMVGVGAQHAALFLAYGAGLRAMPSRGE